MVRYDLEQLLDNELESASLGGALKLSVREPTAEDTTRSLIMMEGKSCSNESSSNLSATIEGLSEEETQRLLSRLPNVKSEGGDQKDFFMRFVFLNFV